MAWFECEGKKSIELKKPILENFLGDREIHELVYSKKNDCLLVCGVDKKDTLKIVQFLCENSKKEVTINGD